MSNDGAVKAEHVDPGEEGMPAVNGRGTGDEGMPAVTGRGTGETGTAVDTRGRARTGMADGRATTRGVDTCELRGEGESGSDDSELEEPHAQGDVLPSEDEVGDETPPRKDGMDMLPSSLAALA